MESKLITRKVPVKLNQDELRDRGERLARLMDRKDRLEAEKKSNAADFKEKIDEVGSEITKVSTDIRNKHEHREVECEKHYNYERGHIEIRRLDTMGVVEEHPMTPEQLRERPKLCATG